MEEMMAQAGGNTEREQWEEQQLLNARRQFAQHEEAIAEENAEIAEIAKRLKALNYTKADLKWWISLDGEKGAEEVAMWSRRLRLARISGHSLARQFDMFDADRTPLEDQAYLDGLAAGKLRKPNVNPHAGGALGQHWQRGHNDGSAFINRDLSDQFAADDADGSTDPGFTAGDDEWNAADPALQAAE